MKKMISRAIFFAMLFTIPSLQAAPVPDEQVRRSDDLGQPSTATAPQVETYDELLVAIRGVRSESQARVEKAVDQEKVREAWETGKLIDEHVLQHKDRADYADQTIIRLARDLGTSETELRYMLQFVRTYPIHRPADELSWSHYESLMAVNDLDERKTLAEKAVKEKWTRDQVRAEVRKRKAARNETQAPEKEIPLTARPGKVGTYRMVKATAGPETGKVVIDLGFSNYYRTSKDLRFKEGDIIEAMPPVAGASAPSDMIRLSKRTPEDLYTYRAWVVNVLDGDTLKAVIDLGFGVRSVQTLRLRGIDCPEIFYKDSATKKADPSLSQTATQGGEGMEAKAFVEDLLKPGTPVFIRTSKSDKYDRYLVDIFFTDKKGEDQYLNNLLLQKGLAVKVQS